MIIIQQQLVKSSDFTSLANEVLFESELFTYRMHKIRSNSEALAIESSHMLAGNSLAMDSNLRVIREADMKQMKTAVLQFLKELTKKLQELLNRFVNHMKLVMVSNDKFIAENEEFASYSGPGTYDYEEAFHSVLFCMKDLESYMNRISLYKSDTPNPMYSPSDIFTLAKKYKQQIFTRNKANKPYSIGELLRFLQQSDQVTARVKSSYHNMITSIARMNGILYDVEDEVFLEMISDKNKYIQSIVAAFNFIMTAIDQLIFMIKSDVRNCKKLNELQ